MENKKVVNHNLAKPAFKKENRLKYLNYLDEREVNNPAGELRTDKGNSCHHAEKPPAFFTVIGVVPDIEKPDAGLPGFKGPGIFQAPMEECKGSSPLSGPGLAATQQATGHYTLNDSAS